jgi:hypothetical protein
MNRRIALGLIAVVLGASLFFLAFFQKGQAISCTNEDGFCPKGCTFVSDSDCPSSQLTSVYEVQRCIADSDCTVVRPICGNLECIFTSNNCEKQCFCFSAINKDYITTWNNAITPCSNVDLQCDPCGPLEETEVACEGGQCKTRIFIQ